MGPPGGIGTVRSPDPGVCEGVGVLCGFSPFVPHVCSGEEGFDSVGFGLGGSVFSGQRPVEGIPTLAHRGDLHDGRLPSSPVTLSLERAQPGQGGKGPVLGAVQWHGRSLRQRFPTTHHFLPEDLSNSPPIKELTRTEMGRDGGRAVRRMGIATTSSLGLV